VQSNRCDVPLLLCFPAGYEAFEATSVPAAPRAPRSELQEREVVPAWCRPRAQRIAAPVLEHLFHAPNAAAHLTWGPSSTYAQRASAGPP